MKHETKRAVSRAWSKSTTTEQGRLIKDYISKYRGTTRNSDHWFEYLAEVFQISPHDSSSAQKARPRQPTIDDSERRN